VTLLDKLKVSRARNWYAAQSLKHGWSSNVLAMQIDTHAYSRAGAAVTNFDAWP
jgi:predicted nuclease of restriction endonuclease-like (RecB) superfamily